MNLVRPLSTASAFKTRPLASEQQYYFQMLYFWWTGRRPTAFGNSFVFRGWYGLNFTELASKLMVSALQNGFFY